jgi:pimeloyl-ACP methyl ester carboxylesterase
MTSFFLYHHSEIHYSRWGKGDRTLVCFPGYGEDLSSFSFLQTDLEKDFTIIAIDLPYQGRTNWAEHDLFFPESLVEIIDGIFEQEKLQRKDTYYLGYSMGGRVILQLAELIPASIGKMILIAPDGLILNKWYWLATQTSAGNKLFRYVMERPAPFLKMVWAGKKLGWINKSVSKFVHHYLGDENMRDELYTRWTCLRKIKPHIATVQKNILQYKICTRFLYGKHDRIILSHRAEQFCKPLKGLATIKTISAGHQLLQEKYKHEILYLINH